MSGADQSAASAASAADPAWAAARAVIARDVRLALRHGAETLGGAGFFIIAVTLFAFGAGPDANMLARIGPGVVWVCALLAVMLGLERLFAADYEDGSLDLTVLSPCPLWALALAKTCALWLTAGAPLVIISPLLAMMLNLDGAASAYLVLTLLLGTPSLCLVGGMGAALTLGARRAGALTALLVLPLYAPVLIFGAGAVDAAQSGFGAGGQISFLGGYLLGALVLCPWAMAAALRQAVE
ncbi:MAG: heme exporter protein CcmB [Rhodospirillales bacterium]